MTKRDAGSGGEKGREGYEDGWCYFPSGNDGSGGGGGGGKSCSGPESRFLPP